MRHLRRALALGSAATAAAGLAACGSTTHVKTVTVAGVAPPPATVTQTATTDGGGTTTTPPTTTTSTPVPKPTDCDALGINQVKLREGACISHGAPVFVVSRGHTAHIKGLTVSLQGMTTQDSLSGSTGGIGQTTANGKFAIATITVTNKLDSAQTWSSDQSASAIATSKTRVSTYQESFNAENGGDQNSCLWKIGGGLDGGLPSGESATCDLVYDIPTHLSPEAHGSNVAVAGWGNTPDQPSGRVAILRTYH